EVHVPEAGRRARVLEALGGHLRGARPRRHVEGQRVPEAERRRVALERLALEVPVGELGEDAVYRAAHRLAEARAARVARGIVLEVVERQAARAAVVTDVRVRIDAGVDERR